MSHRIILFALLGTAILPGCVAAPRSTDKVTAQAWNFPVEGQLDSISAADLVAAIRAVDATHIYRLHVFNHNKVGVDTTPLNGAFGSSSAYQYVERVHRHWEATDGVVITP